MLYLHRLKQISALYLFANFIASYAKFCFAVATIGFAKVSYTVCEEEGARVLLNITKQGPVAGPVNVQYFTLAGQAKGKLHMRPYDLYFNPSIRILQTVEMKISSWNCFSFIDNEDFVPVQPTAVTLQEDDVFAIVSVELVNDEVVEGSEVMFVRLALTPNDISGIQLTADTASVIITDKDGKLLRDNVEKLAT